MTPFHTLQWKITLSYTIATVGMLILLEIVCLFALALVTLNGYPHSLTADMESVASDAGTKGNDPRLLNLKNVDSNLQNPYLDSGSGLSVYLDIKSGFTVITDAQGRVLNADSSSDTGHLPALGKMLQQQISMSGLNALRAAQSGQTRVTTVLSQQSEEVVSGATPLRDKQQRIIALLFTQQVMPSLWEVFQAILRLVGPSLIPFTAIVGMSGCIFGFSLSGGLTRRLQKVKQAAENWSQGNFSLLIQDRSQDEIGQMARRLDTMAKELKELLQARQRLAMLEERNRLARDLHDSLKQQIFAIGMRVGSARLFVEYDLEATRARLDEMGQLITQTQQELAGLIGQLRPVALTDQGLVDGLRDYCTQWSLQHQIAIEVLLEEERMLPLRVEEVLFRVAQEALTNVARHSQASRVQVHLSFQAEDVVLSISDNGQGFDLQIARRKGIGLHSMQERLETIEGSLQITSAPGTGTTVTAKARHVRASGALSLTKREENLPRIPRMEE